jgi:hypothetical protein
MNGWFLNKYIEIKSEIKKEITIYSYQKNPMTLLKQNIKWSDW